MDTPLVEHATMNLAGQAGITVAQTQSIPLVGFNAVALRRFERVRGLRIHSISAGTAIRAATPAGFEPQMGYPELARILRRVGVAQGNVNQSDARELFRPTMFCQATRGRATRSSTVVHRATTPLWTMPCPNARPSASRLQRPPRRWSESLRW